MSTTDTGVALRRLLCYNAFLMVINASTLTRGKSLRSLYYVYRHTFYLDRSESGLCAYHALALPKKTNIANRRRTDYVRYLRFQ